MTLELYRLRDETIEAYSIRIHNWNLSAGDRRRRLVELQILELEQKRTQPKPRKPKPSNGPSLDPRLLELLNLAKSTGKSGGVEEV